MSFVFIAALTVLGARIAADVDSRLEEAACPDVALCRFARYPSPLLKGTQYEPHPEILNTNFWARGLDFSCASPWNDSTGTLRAGTAISRRHVVFAKHFPLWTGVRIAFVDGEGQVTHYTIRKTKSIGKTDIMIGSLDYELAPGIRPAKLLPDDFPKCLGDAAGLPVVTLNQREEALVSELNGLYTNGAPARVWNRHARRQGRTAFGKEIVVGDSGNPTFLFVNGEPILLYCVQSVGTGCGSGPWLHTKKREIQSAMDELCPGYKLECFDFEKAMPR